VKEVSACNGGKFAGFLALMTPRFVGILLVFPLIVASYAEAANVEDEDTMGALEIHVPILAKSCRAVMVRLGGSLADYLLAIKSTNASCPPSSLR
jgi:hypothetical protein